MQQPSTNSSRGASRVGSVKYAHSPYAYRTSADDAPVSPLSDSGVRAESSSMPTYRSPTTLSRNASVHEAQSNPAATHTPRESNGQPLSQPSSPLTRSSGVQEYSSQPIQVGVAPNVHARYRRTLQSPGNRGGAGNTLNGGGGVDSANRGGAGGGGSAFPSSPPSSLPPRSPFAGRDDGVSAFAGGESAPVRSHANANVANAGNSNNPYRMSSNGGFFAPQYTAPLSGSYRGGGGGGGAGSGTQSPSPHYSAHGTPYSPPPQVSGNAAPPYGMRSPTKHTSPTSLNGGVGGGNSVGGPAPSYAPTGFSMPPTMVTSMNSGGGVSGSFHGSQGVHAGSPTASYADPHGSHATSPMMATGGGGRPQQGSSFHNCEPISPTHQFGSANRTCPVVGSYGNGYGNNHQSPNGGGQPPKFVSTRQHSQHQSGSYPAGYHGRVGSGSYTTAAGPFGSAHTGFSHMSAPSHSGDGLAVAADSYETGTKTLSTMADDTMSFSGKSGSSASSIRDDLPLCPNDDACTLINDCKHQKKFAHTCRLFPCYHGHVTRHAKLFRHAAGQVSLPEGLSANTKISTQALASVNFSTISPEAPNAYRIYVSHGDKSYEIFGDWASVKVHTFKRYLHQVYHIAPSAQILSVVKTGKVMDDDINTVKCYGIEEDSVIQLRSNIEDVTGPGRMRISLDDL